jgi:hypothetical protein
MAAPGSRGGHRSRPRVYIAVGPVTDAATKYLSPAFLRGMERRATVKVHCAEAETFLASGDGPAGGKTMVEQRHVDVLEEHLPYELDMLEVALIAWGNLKQEQNESRDAWFSRMSAIEAFWVHARTIYEFFTRSTNAEGRTACANDFTLKQIAYDLGELGSKVDDIHTQIVHLNYNRPRGEAPEKLDYYFAARSKNAIDRAVSLFQKNLKPDAQKHWNARTRMTIATPDGPRSPSSQYSAFSYTGPKDRRL